MDVCPSDVSTIFVDDDSGDVTDGDVTSGASDELVATLVDVMSVIVVVDVVGRISGDVVCCVGVVPVVGTVLEVPNSVVVLNCISVVGDPDFEEATGVNGVFVVAVTNVTGPDAEVASDVTVSDVDATIDVDG